MFSYGCKSNLSTQQLLDGNFITQGQASIDLLSPTQDQQLITVNPTFSWSPRGVNLYSLQISSDPGFGTLLLDKEVQGSNYTVQASDLIGVSSLSTNTYYWRVRAAKIAENLQSKNGSFFIAAIPSGGAGYAGILYVDGSSSKTVQTGGKAAPYKKIQSAITNADLLRSGNSAVNFDVYVAAGTYNESITLAAGISIFGGYKSADWTRSISSNVTTINASADFAVAGKNDITAAYSATTIVDGFTITGGSLAGGVTNYGISLAISNPTITNNIVNGGSGVDSRGIFLVSSSPVIKNNAINGGSAGSTSIGIFCSGTSAPLIQLNTIVGGTANPSYGINCNGSAVITNNVVSGGAVNSSYAALVGGAGTILANNVINGVGTGAGTTYALYINGTGVGSVTNNVIFTQGGAGRYCVIETGGSGDPGSFQNNVLFDCPTALYRDENTTNRTLESDLNTAASTTQGSAGSSSGNLGPASIANFAAMNFLSASDYHLTSSSPLNVRCGGKDTALSTCDSGGASSCGGVTKDFEGILRTATLTGTCVGASNTGASGLSMGPYEKD